jgi:hypothetical protein
MKLKQIHFTTFLLTASIMLSAAEPSDLSHWKDDFSDSAAFAKHWASYGFLAAGIDAKNPLGKPVGGKDSRPEWWQIVDGALRGQNFPEEKHGSGISRNVAAQDMRLSCRFKIPADGVAAKQVLQHTTLSGDAPKTSIGFGVGGNGKTVLATWYDDVSFEPLEAEK